MLNHFGFRVLWNLAWRTREPNGSVTRIDSAGRAIQDVGATHVDYRYADDHDNGTPF